MKNIQRSKNQLYFRINVWVLSVCVILLCVIVAGSFLYLRMGSGNNISGDPANDEITKEKTADLPPNQADFESLTSLSYSLSYPLGEDDSRPNPDSYTQGGNSDVLKTLDSYRLAKYKAYYIAKAHDNSSLPLLETSFANCSAFTATVIINTLDPDFPGNYVRNQRDYVNGTEDGWVKVARGENYNKNKLRAGDVFISRESNRPGHTWIWLGMINGVDSIVAEASYGPKGSATAHLPSLRVVPLDSQGRDSQGRTYDIWRYTK